MRLYNKKKNYLVLLWKYFIYIVINPYEQLIFHTAAATFHDKNQKREHRVIRPLKKDLLKIWKEADKKLHSAHLRGFSQSWYFKVTQTPKIKIFSPCLSVKCVDTMWISSNRLISLHFYLYATCYSFLLTDIFSSHQIIDSGLEKDLTSYKG